MTADHRGLSESLVGKNCSLTDLNLNGSMNRIRHIIQHTNPVILSQRCIRPPLCTSPRYHRQLASTIRSHPHDQLSTLSVRHTSNATDENNPPSPPEQQKDTIFGKIARGEIAVEKIYEDEHCLAFPDVNPQAPTHVLIIPKKPISRISKAADDDKEILASLLIAAKRTAQKLKLDDGYRLVINDGPKGGQTVYHLHVHLLSGRQMTWPPG